MPAGRPLPPGGLLGTWSGTLQLFNVAGGQEITLELRPAGGAYIGVATIALDPVIREAGLEVSVDGREVRFSIASPIDRGLPIRFRGVLVAENRLEGRATITSDELGWDLSGVWTATRH
jgi:hypothetical protein